MVLYINEEKSKSYPVKCMGCERYSEGNCNLWGKDINQANPRELVQFNECEEYCQDMDSDCLHCAKNDISKRDTIKLFDYAYCKHFAKGVNFDPKCSHYIYLNVESSITQSHLDEILQKANSDFLDFLDEYEAFQEVCRSLKTLKSPSENDINGDFDFGNLDTYFPFVNPEHLERIGSQLQEFEKFLTGLSEEEQHRGRSNEDISNLESAMPGLKKLLQMQEIFEHEHFHALQVFSLSSALALTQAFQRIAQVRTSIAVSAILSGLTFRLGHPIFEALVRGDGELVEWLKKQALLLSISFKTVYRAVKSDSSDITTLDLIEGCAYAAQMLTCRSVEFEIFKSEDMPLLYSKAWAMWIENGGSNEIAFLLAADVALRFGDLVSNYRKDNRPEKLFKILAEKARNIEQYFPDETRIGKSFALDQIVMNTFKNNPKALEYLFPTGQRKQAAEQLMIPDNLIIGSSEIHSLMEFSKRLVLEFPDNLLASFHSVTPELFYNEQDNYMGVVGKCLYDASPALGSQKFLLHWIFFRPIRANFEHIFAECNRDETSETISVSVGSGKLNALEYRTLSELIYKLETLLLAFKENQNRFPPCCSKHGISGDIDVYLECNELDSINIMCESNFGRSLEDIIELN